MKMLASLKGKDATVLYILLTVLLLLVCATLYSEKVVQPEDKRHWSENLNPGFRNASIRTKCYSIPYTRNQLKKIEESGGEDLEELRRFLRKKTENDDLSLVIVPPRIIRGEKSSSVCLDFEDPAVESDPFETRLV